MADVTDDHKLTGLKQYELLHNSSGSQRSDVISLVYNQGVSRAVFLMAALKENPFLFLFQLLEAAHSLWPTVPFHLQSQQWPAESLAPCIALTLTLLPPTFM